ncbi:MAG: peroxiredoxin [Verrucomicrobiae bacterium]|nr:peroxiredoxin [Verrucomicrobiae bacterium]
MKPIQTLLAVAVVTAFTLSCSHADPLDVGADAPKLKATDQNGKQVDLGKELSEGTSLVYFYPKADTPGCTKQACNLRDEFEAVKDAGIKVFGVSADTVEDQKKFEEKYTLPFTLLADKKGEIIKAFGVPTLGPTGLASRQSFLIRDGKVIWRDLKAKPTTQAQDAIAAAKAG